MTQVSLLHLYALRATCLLLIALFVNGALVAGSVYGSGTGTQQNNGQVILVPSAGDVVTIVNRSSASAVTLQTLAGETQTNVNASVRILKLS